MRKNQIPVLNDPHQERALWDKYLANPNERDTNVPLGAELLLLAASGDPRGLSLRKDPERWSCSARCCPFHSAATVKRVYTTRSLPVWRFHSKSTIFERVELFCFLIF